MTIITDFVIALYLQWLGKIEIITKANMNDLINT